MIDGKQFLENRVELLISELLVYSLSPSFVETTSSPFHNPITPSPCRDVKVNRKSVSQHHNVSPRLALGLLSTSDSICWDKWLTRTPADSNVSFLRRQIEWFQSALFAIWIFAQFVNGNFMSGARNKKWPFFCFCTWSCRRSTKHSTRINGKHFDHPFFSKSKMSKSIF